VRPNKAWPTIRLLASLCMMGGPKFKGQWYARPRAPGLSAQNIILEEENILHISGPANSRITSQYTVYVADL
jgi:hypothetical protein